MKYLVKYFPLCVGVLVITAITAITGCVAVKPTEPVGVNRAEAVVARDFVSIMLQIEELSPTSTVISFGPEQGNPSEIDARSIKTDNAFGRALRSAVANSGYTVMETLDTPNSDNYVSYSIAEFGDAVDGTTYTYDVSVGEIDFRRVYKLSDNGEIEPFKAMLVRGADASHLETDDSIFARSDNDRKSSASGGESLAHNSTTNPAAEVAVAEPDRALSQLLDSYQSAQSADELSDSVSSNEVVTNQQSTVPLLERPVAVAAPIISELQESGAYVSSTAKTGTVAQSLIGADATTGFKTIRKKNIAVTGQSNYESLLADKKDVVEEVLIFGDDSYVLGVRNKKILGDMMSEFNPVTDVVSVVGCSTGITKIVNGNAALAIGRANRVKEALMYSGIPHDKIFDEGCWSPQANSTPFPNRGVVVTVKRNTGES